MQKIGKQVEPYKAKSEGIEKTKRGKKRIIEDKED